MIKDGEEGRKEEYRERRLLFLLAASNTASFRGKASRSAIMDLVEKHRIVVGTFRFYPCRCNDSRKKVVVTDRAIEILSSADKILNFYVKNEDKVDRLTKLK